MKNQTATSTSAEYDRLLAEAIEISQNIAHELADGDFPKGLTWGHVGDMQETVRELRDVSDRMFGEGEHGFDNREDAWEANTEAANR